MRFDVEIARDARSYLTRLDRATRDRLLDRLDEIALDPYGPKTKALVNAGGRRTSRIGDIRIVYRVAEEDPLILVSAIAPRGRAYRTI